jgi:hypothetical protein
MMKSNFVKIIRNYKSENEQVQENVKANIQPDVSFFDLKVDIKRLDYIVLPNGDEPLVVEKVRVYDSRPPGHKEVILIKESKFYDINKTNNHEKNDINQVNYNISKSNLTVNMYLSALEKAIEQSNIPKNDKEDLIKKVKEISNNQYIKDLSTTAVVDIKEILIG